jgi:hypothetical protein
MKRYKGTLKSSSKREAGRNDLSLLKRMKHVDPLSWFFIFAGSLTTLGVLFMVVLGIVSTQANAMTAGSQSYYDQNMNFSLVVPAKFSIATPDPEETAEEVQKVTGGVLFDMKYHTLSKELVPVALVENARSTDVTYDSFMTLAFRGADAEYTYMQDQVKIMDDFKTLLKSMDHTDIKVSSVENYSKGDLRGVLLRGSGVLKEKSIKYLQYFEPAGKNMLIVTYGYVGGSEKEALNDIDKVIGSLIYQEGGVLLQERGDGAVPSGTIRVDQSVGTDLSTQTESGTPTESKEDGIKAKVESDDSSSIKVKNSDGSDVTN